MTDLIRVFIILFVYLTTFVRAEQTIIESPQDQQAIIGDKVVLKCKIKNLLGEPQWCIDDFCLGSKKDLNKNETVHLRGRPRYKIVGDRQKGEFHLLIEPVQLQDNMFFYCMATAASETIKAVKSKKVFLTVLTYPQSLQLDSPVHVSLNKPSVIQCKAKQSRPPVKIFVSINGNLITDETKYKTEIVQYSANQEDKKMSYVSSISAITNENLRQSYYDTITNLTIEDVSIKMDGQLVECIAYSLFYTNQNLPIVHNRSPATKFFSAQYHQQNSQNFMSTKSNIQVDYAPEVNLKMISANKVLREEDVISLACETKATPQIQSYKWYIGKNYLNGVKDSILNLKLRREMHLKTITCEASNTVASVKAALQLKILFKPTFKKGPKSYMIIEKNDCNKPLTLDCQVNSNPKSNITWYRRKFTSIASKTDSIDPKKSPYLYLFGLGTKLLNNKESVYEDQLIGYGPTYTISSFNCANQLDDLKLKKSEKKLKNKKIIKRQLDDDLDDQEFKPVSYSNEYYDNYDYYDYDEDEYQDEYDDKHTQDVLNNQSTDSTDFGIYICDASNKLTEETESSIRRFIKINPLGPPIGKVLSSQNFNSEEQISLMLKTQEIDGTKQESPIVEVATALGSSVTLTCLVEPLPYLESLIWIKDNGKIIPNSRFSIQDQTLVVNSTSNKTISNKNYKIKHENLTLFNQKISNPEFDDFEEDQDIEEDNADFNKLSLLDSRSDSNRVKSSDSQTVSLVRSVLHIKNIRKQDYGVYKCKSSNSYGSRFSAVLLREQTLIDKLNLNNYIVFLMVIISIVLSIIVFFMFMACLLSTRCRNKCCLFGRKMSSDRYDSKIKINEWLNASNKLHLLGNDTVNVKQLKTTLNKNNTCSTTTEPLLMTSNSPLINESSTKTSQTLTNSPRNESTANCSSSLLEDEEENEKEKLTANSFQPMTRFMVSSPMINTKLNEDQPAMLLIRSQNFNAKISNYDVDNRFISTLQRQQHLNKLKQEESPYRLSDLFNELSPMNTFSGTLNNRLCHNNVSSSSSPSSTQSPSSRCNANVSMNKFPNPFDNKNHNHHHLHTNQTSSYFHHLNI